MAVVRIPTDVDISGNLAVGGALAIPAGAVNDSQVGSAAAIDVAKVRHIYLCSTDFDQPIGGTPVAYETVVFSAIGAFTIRNFRALLNDTGTTTDIDFDLLINGVSALAAAVNITNADTDGNYTAGTISSAALVDNDVVSISCAVTTSTGAQGPFAVVSIEGAAY